MRSYQLVYLLLFILFYVLITFGTSASLARIIKKGLKNKIRKIIYTYSFLLIVSFLLLYIWPDHAWKNGNYSTILIFNTLLSIDLGIKFPISLSFLFGSFFTKNEKVVIFWMGLIIAICFSSNIFYASIIDEHHVVLKQVELPFTDLPQGFDGYKIMQISDIHLGNFICSKKNLQETTQLIHKLNPDLFVFTGDIVNNYSEELNGWGDTFREMNKGTINISILGNHDYGDYSRWASKLLKEENFDQIVEAHKRFGFNLLRNQNTVLTKGNDSIYIIGVENWGLPPFPQYADLKKAMDNVPDNAFKILLSHDPAHWDRVVKYMDNIDLTLSGHTHGMQWGIKKAGITFSLIYFVRNEWGGLYQYGKSLLYVNTGIGTIGFPWRINMPGEVTLFTLKRSEVDRKEEFKKDISCLR